MHQEATGSLSMLSRMGQDVIDPGKFHNLYVLRDGVGEENGQEALGTLSAKE